MVAIAVYNYVARAFHETRVYCYALHIAPDRPGSPMSGSHPRAHGCPTPAHPPDRPRLHPHPRSHAHTHTQFRAPPLTPPTPRAQKEIAPAAGGGGSKGSGGGEGFAGCGAELGARLLVLARLESVQHLLAVRE